MIVYSPMQSGLLTGKMTRERVENFPDSDHRKRKPYFQEPALTRNLELADRLKQIAERHGRSTAEAAIAWTLRHPAVTGAIVGIRDPKQVEGVIGAATFRLTDTDIEELERAPGGMVSAAS